MKMKIVLIVVIVILVVGVLFLMRGKDGGSDNALSEQRESEEASAYGTFVDSSGTYPTLWAEANLPQYPDAKLTKERQGNSLKDGVQVTFETDDSMEEVIAFWDTELEPLGLVKEVGLPGKDRKSVV